MYDRCGTYSTRSRINRLLLLLLLKEAGTTRSVGVDAVVPSAARDAALLCC